MGLDGAPPNYNLGLVEVAMEAKVQVYTQEHQLECDLEQQRYDLMVELTDGGHWQVAHDEG